MENFFVKFVYKVLSDYGINTKDMEPYEAIEKYKELLDRGEVKESNSVTQSSGDNVKELSNKLTDKKWEQSLSNEEKDAIKWYSAYSDKINGILRGERDDITPLDKRRINAIDNAIDSYELRQPITVYRRLNKKHISSGINKDNAFVSTSISREVVLNTLKDKENEIIYEYKLPAVKGIGAYINNLSSYKNGEYEFLIGRGTKFKELDRRIENGLTYIKWGI